MIKYNKVFISFIQISYKAVIVMAKRRSETGKTGKHQHGESEYSYESMRSRTRRNRIIFMVITVVAITIISATLLYIILSEDEETKKEEVSLTTETPHQGGFPLDVITFDYTIHNL